MIKVSPKVKNVMEWIFCIIVAVILALLFRHFIGTPTIVQMPSMKTTLMPNDRLILNRWVATVNGKINREDIITFEAPTGSGTVDNPIAKYDYNPTKFWEKFNYYFLENGKKSYIKRVIGIAGDHIEIKDNKVYRNGEMLNEEYLQSGIETTSTGGTFTDVVVPDGCIFVMGDNRPQSADSRQFGCIPLDRVESRVLFRFWPLNKFGKVK